MATGHFPRRRSRPGYLACADPLGLHRERNEAPDRPEEEFRLFKRVYGGKERFYRNSYCRACESAYNGQKTKALAATDPAYRARQQAKGRRSYRENAGATKQADRKYRLGRAKELVVRLNAAGWSCERIATATGINTTALRAWRRAEGRPGDDHILRLKGLVERCVAALTGPLGEVERRHERDA